MRSLGHLLVALALAMVASLDVQKIASGHGATLTFIAAGFCGIMAVYNIAMAARFA